LELELELIRKTRIGIGIDSKKQELELELIQKTRIGIGIDSKNTNWN
jgi:hypothetical protein